MTKENSDKVVKLSQLKVACKNCGLYDLCLPLGLDGSDLEKLENIIKRSHVLKKGDILFHQGDTFHSLYAVRSGSIKTYTIDDNGSEQITGFHLPGELVGLDAISDEKHPGYTMALETTSYCEIPFEKMEALSGELPSLRRQLLRVMSKEITQDVGMLMLLGKKTAEERLASLLLSLSTRFKERGFSAREFNLSMSRNDIGNYLGLAVETVSRLFTRFQEQGMLRAQGKHIELLNLDALKCMVSDCKGSQQNKMA